MPTGDIEVHRDIDPGPAYDAFWIFALWRALHGGDPTLADVAAAAIASLSQFLPVSEDSFGMPPLPLSPCVAVSGIEDSESAEDSAFEVDPDPTNSQEELALYCQDPHEFSVDHSYFNVNGVFYRIDRPAFASPPTAA